MSPDLQTARQPASTPLRRPMDPRDRLRLCGPVRPMAHPASLIERLLFG